MTFSEDKERPATNRPKVLFGHGWDGSSFNHHKESQGFNQIRIA